jgi:hypothetical protein
MTDTLTIPSAPFSSSSTDNVFLSNVLKPGSHASLCNPWIRVSSPTFSKSFNQPPNDPFLAHSLLHYRKPSNHLPTLKMSVTLHNYVQWWKPTSYMPVFINMLDSTLTPLLPHDSFSLPYLYEISQIQNIQHVFCMTGFHEQIIQNRNNSHGKYKESMLFYNVPLAWPIAANFTNIFSFVLPLINHII